MSSMSPGFVSVFALFAVSALPAQTASTVQESATPPPAADHQILGTDTAGGEASLPLTPTVSQVRIVRLSEIRGEAKLDRNTGRGFEPAFANIPITAHSRLRTEAGLAEVEFEDNSTLRLTPDTEVEFTQLGRAADGATVTRCKVEKGSVYVSLVKGKATDFTLVAGDAVLRPNPGSHLRLDMPDTLATLAVMEGSVDFNGKTSSTVVPKKSMLTFGLDGVQGPQMVAANKVSDAPFDGWDKQGNAFQSRYANASFAGGTGLSFGTGDLNYYGGFADVGCGSMWRPYFANAAWDPYGAGTWALYPGAGYSFVSPYPWGWLPFHSGSWVQCGGAGWGWQPGNSFYGLNNIAAATVSGGALGGRATHAPLRPPVGRTSLVSIGAKSVEPSSLTREGTFTFRQNSAGLGVPRETFGHLAHASASVERHGFANTEASVGYVTAPTSARAGIVHGAAAPVATARTIPVITRSSGGGNVASFGQSTLGARSNAGPATSSLSSRSSVSAASPGRGGGSASGGGGAHR